MTNQEILKLGWKEIEDRGMAENYGGLFRKNDIEMRHWTVYPRFNFSKNGSIIYDSYLDYEVDPYHTKPIPVEFLQEKMIEFNV